MEEFLGQGEPFFYYGRICHYKYFAVTDMAKDVVFYRREKFTLNRIGGFARTSKSFALTIDAKKWHSKPPVK